MCAAMKLARLSQESRSMKIHDRVQALQYTEVCEFLIVYICVPFTIPHHEFCPKLQTLIEPIESDRAMGVTSGSTSVAICHTGST